MVDAEKTSVVEQTKVEIPENSQLLDGNLYRVPTDSVRYVDGALDFDSKEMKAINPRYASMGGKVMPAGLTKLEISELRESIRSDGLTHPLRARPMKDKDGKIYLQLINGERRLRAINTLRKSKERCFNPRTQKFEPADKVYEFVEVRVTPTDAKGYYKAAFTSNDTGVRIGEGAEAALVRYLRHCGLSDPEILEITGKSTSWLVETDKLMSLDEKTFSFFAEGELSRSAALKLSQIPDVSVRQDRLEKAKSILEAEFAAKVAKAVQEADEAENEAETAEAAEAVTEAIGGDVAAAKAETEKAVAKATKKKTLKEKLVTKQRKITGKNIEKVLTDSGDDVVKALTRAKIEKCHDEVKGMIKAKGLSAETGELVEGYDEPAMRLIEKVLHAVLNGQSDMLKVCRQHLKQQAKRAETPAT